MHFSHKHQVMLTITIIAVLFIIILFMLGPTIRGHNIIKDLKKHGLTVDDVVGGLERMNVEKEVLNVKLNTCNNVKKELENQIKKFSSDLVNAQQKLVMVERDTDVLKINFENNISLLKKDYEKEIFYYKEENQRLNERLNTIEDDLNLIIHNAANNICCKYRVDYPQTDSYFISNNRIICSVGEENKINCS